MGELTARARWDRATGRAREKVQRATKRRRWGLIVVVLAVSWLAAACTPPPRRATPALWRVRGPNSTIWLLGTIHLLPPGTAWQTPVIAHAMASADLLVTELPDTPVATAALFARAARADDAAPVTRRVGPQWRRALPAAAAAANVTIAALDAMKSWAAALALANGAAATGGGRRGEGVEPVLAAAFRARHRPQIGCETAAEQIAMFDSLPLAVQRDFLERAIDEAPHGGEDYREMVAAWASGDERRIGAAIEPALSALPAVRDAVVVRRNRRWAALIAARRARPGRVLIAVGVGHLVGPQSVVALLRAHGIAVDRVG